MFPSPCYTYDAKKVTWNEEIWRWRDGGGDMFVSVEVGVGLGMEVSNVVTLTAIHNIWNIYTCFLFSFISMFSIRMVYCQHVRYPSQSCFSLLHFVTK